MSAGSAGARSAVVRALAKINLDLRVLGKRPDGFHELRTVFQTISLSDRITLTFTRAKKTQIALDDALAIPDNLVVRAAQLALDAMRVHGTLEMRLEKRIPMGAGLGGGSSDAAAVLLALPVLAGRNLSIEKLCELGQQLGSDVPFFLLGGTAVGIGRGTELFPMADAPARPGLLIAPGIHVNTAQAYRDLSRRLTIESQPLKMFSFQSHTWELGGPPPPGDFSGARGRVGKSLACPVNDFEAVVFEQHGKLADLKRRLTRAGASCSMMTGSGSAMFGLFPGRQLAERARELLGKETALPISLVGRTRYRSIWWRQLAAHIDQRTWPPPSRYSR